MDGSGSISRGKGGIRLAPGEGFVVSPVTAAMLTYAGPLLDDGKKTSSSEITEALTAGYFEGDGDAVGGIAAGGFGLLIGSSLKQKTGLATPLRPNMEWGLTFVASPAM